MSADGLSALKSALAELRSQLRTKKDDIEDLRVDKRDLRSQNEELKLEVTRLKDELRETRSELTAALNETRAMKSGMEGSSNRVQSLSMRSGRRMVKESVASLGSPEGKHIMVKKEKSPSVELINPPLRTRKGNKVKHNSRGWKEDPRGPASHLIEAMDKELPSPPLSAKAMGKRKATASVSRLAKKARHDSPVDEREVAPVYALDNAKDEDDNKPALSAARPMIKIKEEAALVLPPSLTNQYLNGAPPLTVDPEPSSFQISRISLHKIYNGSPYHFIQYIPPALNPSGRRRRVMMFPTHDMNPGMPLFPGESGLMLASQDYALDPPPWSVFRRNLDGKTATWLYLGEYESKLVGTMSPEIFRGQKEAVKRVWANHLMTQKKYDCYTAMRARIALRKAKKIPVDNKAQDVDNKALEYQLVQDEIVRIKAGKGRPVTEEDIIAAFSRGDEGIDINRLQCVSYDRTFADDMEAKHKLKLEQEGNDEDEDKDEHQDKKPRKSRPKATIQTKPKTRGQAKSESKAEECSHSIEEEFMPASSRVVKAEVSASPSLTRMTRSQRANKSAWDSHTGRRVPVKLQEKPSSGHDMLAGRDSGEESEDQGDDDGYLSYVSEE